MDTSSFLEINTRVPPTLCQVSYLLLDTAVNSSSNSSGGDISVHCGQPSEAIVRALQEQRRAGRAGSLEEVVFMAVGEKESAGGSVSLP